MRESKARYPFRIGCTSYVKPDDIIPNVEYMGCYVDDMELVLFESPEISNLPSEDDISSLARLASEHDLTYSVHFPTTHKAGGGDAEAFREDVKRVVELTAPLDPFAWILHLEGLEDHACKDEVAQWQEAGRHVLAELSAQVDDMSKISVENLAYPWALHSELTSGYGASLCLDVGHLWINSPGKWGDEVKAMLPMTRVVHLHGLCDGRDHVSLQKSNEADLRAFLSQLKRSRYDRLVTLEVFSEQDTAESLDLLGELW